MKKDEWLSAILEKNAYSLDLSIVNSPILLKETLRQTKKPTFVYAKVPSGHSLWPNWLKQEGFQWIDSQITFEKPVDVYENNGDLAQVRHALPQDEKEVVDLAARGFSHTRFHVDPKIQPEKANQIEAQWAQNFFRQKRGDQMIVALREGKVAGFCQVILQEPHTIVIDLICTDAMFRRQGVARSMIGFVQSQNVRMKTLRINTEGSNTESNNLYQKMGMKPIISVDIFHYHG
jgi:ribosomal protein S18 acetylase RimI-like enzyme